MAQPARAKKFACAAETLLRERDRRSLRVLAAAAAASRSRDRLDRRRAAGIGGAGLPASEVSILTGSRVAPAMPAMTIDRTMNRPPRTEVERVRKSAAPRAVMKPDELPPTPRPPPSERCIRITPTSETAMRRLDDQEEGEHRDLSSMGARRLNRRRSPVSTDYCLSGGGGVAALDLRFELLGGQPIVTLPSALPRTALRATWIFLPDGKRDDVRRSSSTCRSLPTASPRAP